MEEKRLLRHLRLFLRRPWTWEEEISHLHAQMTLLLFFCSCYVSHLSVIYWGGPSSSPRTAVGIVYFDMFINNIWFKSVNKKVLELRLIAFYLIYFGGLHLPQALLIRYSIISRNENPMNRPKDPPTEPTNPLKS